MRRRAALLLAIVLPTLAVPAAGQLPSANAAHLGIAETGAARARGFGAGALNPANLALPGNPALSLTLLPLRVERSLDPVTLGDLADYQGRPIPSSVKEAWLGRIERSGRQVGAVGLQVTGAALSFGAVGLQVSTLAVGQASLNPDAAELLLFGNVGRTGSPRTFVLDGSAVDAFAATTLGVSAGQAVEADWLRDGERLTFGITLKYTVGHRLLVGRDGGTTVSDQPVDVRVEFPVIESRGDPGAAGAGSGVGLDVGAAWERGPWTLGLVARNLVQTFRWNPDALRFRPGEALFGGGEGSADFTSRPTAEAPPSLREIVFSRGFAFERELSAAVAYELSGRVTLTGEAHRTAGTGPVAAPSNRVGAGAELRLRPTLPLRFGAALVSGGAELGAGMGVRVGRVAVDAGGLLRVHTPRPTSVVQLTVSYRRR